MGEGESGGKLASTVARLPQSCALVLIRQHTKPAGSSEALRSFGAAFIADLRRTKPGVVSSTPPLRAPLNIGPMGLFPP